jgi:hypothetical protein
MGGYPRGPRCSPAPWTNALAGSGTPRSSLPRRFKHGVDSPPANGTGRIHPAGRHAASELARPARSFVRTEATNLCYSNVSSVLGVQPPATGAAPPPPSVLAAPSGARRMNDMASSRATAA